MATTTKLVFFTVAISVLALGSSHTLSRRVPEQSHGGNSAGFPGQTSEAWFGAGGPLGAVNKGQQGPEYVSVDKSFSGNHGGNAHEVLETVLFKVAAR